MLKRIICAIVAILSLVTFTACNEEAVESTDEAASKDVSGVEYYVEYRGQKITMGADAEAIITGLGEYQSKKEIGDCGGLGAQVRYSYPSVDVYVLESKTDGNVIDEISFRDDGITTPEGVFIGMTVAEAKGKLGTPTKESDTVIEYAGAKFVLVITISDGKVNKIDYLNV